MAKFGKLSVGKVGEVEDRGVIAQWVVIGSAVGLVLLSIVVIWAAKDKQGKELIETTRMVYTSLLPLLGTWVGTVLAYYFSKDNFEAATKSTRDNLEIALQQRLEKLQMRLGISVMD